MLVMSFIVHMFVVLFSYFCIPFVCLLNDFTEVYSYLLMAVYIGDQGIVYLFVGHVNRHWSAFAKRCINNRTIRHDAKGTVPIVYCLRKMHLWGSKLHADFCIPSRFYLGWSAFLGTMSKNSCPALLSYMTEGWRLLRLGLGVVPAITYHCNAVPVIHALATHTDNSTKNDTLFWYLTICNICDYCFLFCQIKYCWKLKYEARFMPKLDEIKWERIH